jgi:Flp pilus assembly protein TadG
MSRIFRQQASACPIGRRLAADQRGVTAIVTGLGLTVLLGFAGVAIDVAYWLNSSRGLQAAADQAAYSAAVSAGSSGCSSTTYAQQARAVAAARGYIDGQNATVAVSCRSSDISFTVQIDQDQPLWFTNMFLSSAPRATASATAQAAAKVSDLCVLALDGTIVDEGVTGSDASAFWLNGSAGVTLHCGVAVDSSNNAALSAGGSANLAATDVYLVGDMQGSPSGSASITTSPTANNILKNQVAIADPYLNRTIPAHSSCSSYSMTTYANTGTVNPGVYCGGLTLGGNSPSAIVLVPGVYYIVAGTLEISSKATITSTGGVTFVLTGDTTHGYATATINGNANVVLSAPTTGPTGGMLFFGDRNAPFSGAPSNNASCGSGGGGSSQNQINGGSGQLLTGVLYFPNQSVCYGGSSAVIGAGKCTQIIARTISFTGSSDVRLSCAGTGVEPITVTSPQLIK